MHVDSFVLFLFAFLARICSFFFVEGSFSGFLKVKVIWVNISVWKSQRKMTFSLAFRSLIRTFAPNMNWSFILQWVITFTVCLLVYDLTGSFWMSLGILILLIVAKSLIEDYIEKRKRKEGRE